MLPPTSSLLPMAVVTLPVVLKGCSSLQIWSAVSLIGKEAPDHARGAVFGLFSLFGAVGILMIAQVGGVLFDRGLLVGPFLFMAGANALMLALTLGVIAWTRSRAAPAA